MKSYHDHACVMYAHHHPVLVTNQSAHLILHPIRFKRLTFKNMQFQILPLIKTDV
jgi:hypothetical protein